MKIKIFVSFFMLFTTLPLRSQENPCDCSAYNSLLHWQEYENIFPPESIKSQDIKQFTFYTTRKVLKKVILDTLKNDYKEIQFKFDKEGFVKEIVWHNRMGIPHSNYTIKRNKQNRKMASKTFQYIDETGNLSNSSPAQTTDYFYNKSGLLIKIKNRGYQGEIFPDSLSSYTKFEYDSKERIVSFEKFTYYDWTESPLHKANTVYKESDRSSKTTYYVNSDLLLTKENSYDKNWNKIKSTIYNHSLTSPLSEETWKYDKQGKLIYYSTKTFKSEIRECPDNGNFEEIYEYDENNILQKVIHKFGDVECQMSIKNKSNQ